jgi:hypothetical protein
MAAVGTQKLPTSRMSSIPPHIPSIITDLRLSRYAKQLIIKAAWGDPMPKSIMLQFISGALTVRKLPSEIPAFGFFLITLNILFEIGNQHMITEIFQFAIRIPFQRCLTYSCSLCDIPISFEAFFARRFR